MDKIRNNIKTILLIGITLILAGAAVFTAWKLYETRFQAIAPTAPEGVPAADEHDGGDDGDDDDSEVSTTPSTTQCSTVTFSLASATTGPTTAPTAAPTASANPTSTAAPTATASSSSSSSSKGGSAATATPSTQLPAAGVSWPTIGAVTGGILLAVVGILLAF